MAKAKGVVAEVDVLLDVTGFSSDIRESEAIARAQAKNARLAEDRMRMIAEAEVGKNGLTNPASKNRSRGSYPGSMSQYYTAEVDANGDVVTSNPTARASYFEFGTPEHEIWASGLFGRGRSQSPRGSRGQFSKGAQALTFDWAFGHFVGEMVEHPGQEANPVIGRTMEELLPEFAENVLDELAAEVARG